MSDPTTAIPADADRTAVPGAGEGGARLVVIGGGPGGYEAALTAARLGADVTVVSAGALGGAAVLTDVVPSKTLIATADVLDLVAGSGALGIRDADTAGSPGAGALTVDLAAVNARVRRLARAQSADVEQALQQAGVRVLRGHGRLEDPRTVAVVPKDGQEVTERLPADAVLLALGARPRELPEGRPDGERILTWTQLYDLDELPSHLVVVGSGATGPEPASADRAPGWGVRLVSSRAQVLPGSDRDAAGVLEEAFRRRGVHVRSRSRAAAARREGDGVVVTLTSGEEIRGSHVLLALGAIPATAGLGLEECGVRLRESGHVVTDRVSRTSVPGVYAAGDCTGVLPLASVAAIQGRTAVHHALGEAVSPLIRAHVASAVFTSPEIATVGASEQDVEDGTVVADVRSYPLGTNARAKMQGVREGFVKLIVRHDSGTVLGGVVVAPRASELIHPITLAVAQRLTVEQLANTSIVYPSMTGSLAEAARQIAMTRGT